jgi:hypothetical protein
MNAFQKTHYLKFLALIGGEVSRSRFGGGDRASRRSTGDTSRLRLAGKGDLSRLGVYLESLGGVLALGGGDRALRGDGALYLSMPRGGEKFLRGGDLGLSLLLSLYSPRYRSSPRGLRERRRHVSARGGGDRSLRPGTYESTAPVLGGARSRKSSRGGPLGRSLERSPGR